MTITIKTEMDFEDIRRECWSGAKDTMARISECGKEDEFMDLLDDTMRATPTMTDLNDYLWFDADYIYDSLGISEDDEDEEEYEMEEEEDSQ